MYNLIGNTHNLLKSPSLQVLRRVSRDSYTPSEDSLGNLSDSIDRSRRCLPLHHKMVNELPCPRKKRCLLRRGVWIGFLLSVLGIVAALIWLTLLMTLPRRHKPRMSSSGIDSVVERWRRPSDSATLLSPWKSNFTKNIIPMACHSHNDYWRYVPLFEALAAGCTGIEADIWLINKAGKADLLIGHSAKSLKEDRTLQNLYIKPLVTILENQNNDSQVLEGGSSNFNGVFQSSPTTTLTLLLDFKSGGADIWHSANQELEALRSRGWLTYWSKSAGKISWRPIIVVATGKAPFDLLLSNTTYRDVFYDAPLEDISNSKYDSSNSYYASTPMSTLGKIWLWKFSSKQVNKIKTQIAMANEKGLKARYWKTPGSSVIFREYIWGILVENGVGMLNVDVFPSSLFYLLVTRFGQNSLVW